MALDITKLNKERVQKLIGINLDSRRYFFSKANEDWLDWLWSNGFLDVIKQKGQSLDSYGYITPELDYLAKVAVSIPDKVVDIILSVPITQENYNPEVADRFLWIVSELPLEQLKKVVSKIKEEGWPKLMRRYGHSAFYYKKMVEKTVVGQDFETLLSLAEIILSIRTKEEITQTANAFGTDTPFYFDDIEYTEIFENLIKITDGFTDTTLRLISETVKNIVLLEQKYEDEPFDYGDPFYLFDVDFFSLDLNNERNYSYRDNIRNLMAVFKNLISRKLLSSPDQSSSEDIYLTYIDSLPLSRTMWRFSLFVLSLQPEHFKQKIKESLFKIFNEKKWSHLISGAEYEWLLEKTFLILDSTDKNTYIEKVFTLFGDPTKESFYKKYGYDLLSCIESFLTDGQKNNAKEIFGRELSPNHIPEPSVSEIRSGTIVPQSPISEEDFNIDVTEIAKKLSTEWSPESIKKTFGDGDMFRPYNAEGVSEKLQKDISKRIQDYINNSELFFVPSELHTQYTYAYLRGIYDVISKSEFTNQSADLNPIFNLFQKIKDEGAKGNLPVIKDESNDGWLATWTWVHSTMADVLKDILGENKETPLVDFLNNREKILEIIKYLLDNPNPTTEENLREHGGDPFTTAINSVRGKAFQALTIFTYQDSLTFDKDTIIKIKQDVMDIYEKVLSKENTYAIMFMYGHYLPTFYYKNPDWIKSKLDLIFPHNSSTPLFISSWEGYVSNSLYKELFTELKSFYEYSIDTELPKEDRRYFKDVDEGIGTHIALAYMHFDDFNLDSDLFKKFWKSKNINQHSAFVSFVGRYAISRDNGASFREKNKISIEKIQKLWDWILSNCNEAEVFSDFGFWINDQSNAFDITWLTEHAYQTIQKSNGKLDWEYGMMKSLSKFAEEAPVNTLKLLNSYMIGSKVADNTYHLSIYIETEVFDTLKILYGNPDTKEGVENLIARLLPLGNGRFWKFKEVIKKRM